MYDTRPPLPCRTRSTHPPLPTFTKWRISDQVDPRWAAWSHWGGRGQGSLLLWLELESCFLNVTMTVWSPRENHRMAPRDVMWLRDPGCSSNRYFLCTFCVSLPMCRITLDRVIRRWNTSVVVFALCEWYMGTQMLSEGTRSRLE